MTRKDAERERTRTNTNLRRLARALDDARHARTARPGTLRHVEQLVQGPVVIKISLADARSIGRLLRELAAGKSSAAALGLPEPGRGRRSQDAPLRFLFVEWLRLRARPMSKTAAHAELRRQHPTAPSVHRLDRWWNDQGKDQRQLVIDVAERRTYRRVGDQVTVTRVGPDLTSVLEGMKRGAKRGRF